MLKEDLVLWLPKELGGSAFPDAAQFQPCQTTVSSILGSLLGACFREM